MTAAPDAAQVVEMMNAAMPSTIPTAHQMGVRVVEARRGYAAVTVPAEGNGNHFGVVYAGVQFTVAEMLGGVIALSTFDNAKYFPLVKMSTSSSSAWRDRSCGLKPASTRRRSAASKPKPTNAERRTSHWKRW